MKIVFISSTIVGDVEGYYAYLPTLIIDGDLEFSNQFQDFSTDYFSQPTTKTKTGYTPNKYTIGAALLWLPFFLLGHITTLLLSCFNPNLATDGYSIIHEISVSIGSITYGVLGLYLIGKTLDKYFESDFSFLSILILTFGTNLFFYIYINPTMSHSLSLFAISLLFWYLYVYDNSKWLVIGLILGLAAIIRPQNLIFGLFLLPKFYSDIKEFGVNSMIPKIAMSFFGFLLICLPQLIVWKILYGSFLVFSYEGESFDFSNPQLYDILLSSNNGLIQTTPLIAVALLGLGLSFKDFRFIAILLSGVFLLQWFVNSSWHCWWFGYSFGNRAFISCSLIFAFGFAYFLKISKYFKSIVYPIFLILIMHNILYALTFDSTINQGQKTFIEVFSNHPQSLKYFLQRFGEYFI